MKPRFSKKRNHALTLVEVLVIVFVLACLVAISLPRLAAAKRNSPGPWCINNLKQISLAARIWASDNDDKYPFEISVTIGGTMELNHGRNAWMNFLVMSNELSTPKVLICPQDAKHLPAASNFSAQLAGHVSYFVGLDAKERHPQLILSGDDNLEIGGIPAKPSYLELSTNAPITWSADRHKSCGNIVFADGSVQQLTTNGLQRSFYQTGLATNRLAIP
jgi:prepilin-type processing-associated H-X9-DG protein